MSRRQLHRTTAFRTAVAAALPIAASVGFSTPASANPPGYQGDTVDLTKNYPGDIRNSTFTMYDNYSVYAQRQAGTGDGQLDECITNHGVIPDGYWGGQASYWHEENHSGAIGGRVWRLQDMHCYDSTLRTAMFIHTEELSNQGQSCCNSAYRWDGDVDYYSNGCVKLSSGSGGDGIATMDDWWHNKAGGGTNSSFIAFLNVHW